MIGNSSVSGNSTLTFDSGTSTFAGTIQDTLGSGTQKVALYVGSGTLSLTGPSTYTGKTTVDRGTLVLGQGGSLGGTPVSVFDNGAYATAFTSNGGTSNGGGLLNLGGGNGTVNLQDGHYNTLAFSGPSAGEMRP